MKKWIALLLLCTMTIGIGPDGQTVTCQTCCSYGSCTVVCF